MKRLERILLPAALFCALATPAGARQSGPERQTVALDAILDLARERNPRLAALRAAAEAAAHREPEASTLPDPAVQLGVMNFGLPDFNADMPTSMAPSVQLMQMVPFPGKLSLRGRVASLGREMAELEAEEAWWEVRGRASAMFFDLYGLDRRIEVMEATLALLQDFREVARAMYEAGSGRQADVLRADVEVARMDGEIRTMRAMREGASARLNAMLDRPADTPVPTPSLGSQPRDVPAAATLSAWAMESRPLLARGRTGVTRAATRVELARRQIWPDLTFGVTYGRRDRGAGTEHMGSAMVGFTLPIHAGKRQDAQRDEAEAMQRIAEAELGGLRAEVDARIGELLAELDRVRALTDLYRDEVLPQARATVASAFGSYRVGAVDFMTLVDAQMTVNRFEGELHELLGDYGRAVAALESTVGRPLPRTGPSMAEAAR